MAKTPAVNPNVVYCSLTGFGQDGPLRDTPGHDVNFQAIAGALTAKGPSAARRKRTCRYSSFAIS